MNVTGMAGKMFDLWHTVHLHAFFSVTKDISDLGNMDNEKKKKNTKEEQMTK